jgi:hypothetical protein
MGRPSTTQQEQFVQFMMSFLRANNLTPQTAGYTYFDNQQPLKSVRDCMRDCTGALVLAYERTYIKDGEDRRGSSDGNALTNTSVTTVWNQMEGAMAIALGKPLLVLCEESLKEEGVLQDKYEEWRVKRIPLNPAIASDSDFIARFEYWKKQVEDSKQLPVTKSTLPTFDPASMTVGQLVQCLKPAQIWAVLGALLAIIGSAATLAYKLGQTLPKGP